MKVSGRSIERILSVILYLTVLVCFVISLYGIIVLNDNNHQRDEFSNTFNRAKISATEFSFTSGSLTSAQFASVNRFAKQEVTPKIQRHSLFMLCVAGCSIAFAVSFVSIPLYSHFRFTRPAAKLANTLIKNARGEKVDAKEINIQSMPGLSGAVQKLLRTQHNAENFIHSISNGDFDVQYTKSDSDHFGDTLISMQHKLKTLSETERKNAWIRENLSTLERLLKENSDMEILSDKVISLLTKSISAGVGMLYGLNDKEADGSFFYLLASSGYFNDKKTAMRIVLGDGQLGEAGAKKRTVVLNDLPGNYITIHSGLGSSSATAVIIVPLLFKNNLYGALEIASFKSFDDHEVKWLETACESLAAHFFNQKVNAEAKEKLQELTTRQADELVEIHRLQANTYSKLELKLKEVEEEKMKTQAILEGCVDGVITFSDRGEISFTNKVAEEIFGRTKNELSKSRIFELVAIRIDVNGKGNLIPYYIGDHADKEIAVRTEACIKSQDGSAVDVLITATQVQTGNETLFTFFIQKISVDLF